MDSQAKLGSYYLARCTHCKSSVILTPKVRRSTEGNLLDHLDSIIPCCQSPSYYYFPYPVYSYPEGEEEPTKEDKSVDKFWMVIKAEGKGGEYTRQRHPSHSTAVGEAERLTKAQNATYIVLEAVEACSPKETPVNWEPIT